MSRRMKIIAMALLGAYIGSSLGIAGMGTAIAGTIPLAILFGYIAFMHTKPSPKPPEIIEIKEEV